MTATNSTTFLNNQARTELWDGIASGGAIYVGRGNIIVIRDVLFLNNQALADRASSFGGALDVWGSASIVNSRFINNVALGPDDIGYSPTKSVGAGMLMGGELVGSVLGHRWPLF